MPSNPKATRSKKRYSLIQNNIHRNNTKCKRKRNLIKKCMQLSKLCEQEILLVIHDKKLGKIYRYSSEEAFNISHVKQLVRQAELCAALDDSVQLFSYTNKDILQFSTAQEIEAEEELKRQM